jgi:hypothetical protein
MIKANMACPECEADFNIKHDMEERLYIPRFCVFCGEEIATEGDEMNFDLEENEDDGS